MKLSKLKAVVFGIFALTLSSLASAHLVTFGWTDNGDGTVTLWGEHWHADQTVPSTANGGIHIYAADQTTLLYTVQWSNVLNNTDRDDMVANGTLTGYQDGINGSTFNYNDWLYTDDLVIGDGTYYFFTGTTCCIDTMDNMVEVTLSGITSVTPGTGPGDVSVPEPSSLFLLGAGLLGLGLSRRKKA